VGLLVAEGLAVSRPTGGAAGEPAAGEPAVRSVIESLDLTLDPGELRGIVGPSGSGKTTLLRALAGLEPLSAGRLSLDGRPIEEWSPASWRRRVGYLAQRPVMLPGTVADNLAWPARLRTADEGQPLEYTHSELLQAVDLPAALLQRPATELSEGQAARVGLLRSVLAGPQVLLLDEPTAALDEDTADVVEAFLRQLAEAGTAVAWVLHDTERARRLPGELLEITMRGEG